MFTAAAAVFVVLLYLHASDTLTEDHADVQSLPTQKLTSTLQTAGSGASQNNLRKPQRVISPQDEDLLDLMVRIAETPAEWDRIHRVLSQLGVEHKKSDEERQTANSTKTNMTYSSHLEEQIQQATSSTKTSISKSNTLLHTMVSLQETSTAEYLSIDYQNDQSRESSEEKEDDTGWPDFEEAILKNVKKPHISNDIIESGWFENDWFDTTLNDILNGLKDHESIMKDKEEKTPSVSFVPSKAKSENMNKKGENAGGIRHPNLSELLIQRNQTSSSSASEGVNRTTRPLFQYHRVTTSSQERKGNGAFIAVSVVKQSQLEPPITTQAPLIDYWSPPRLLDRTQKKQTQSPAESYKRRPPLLWEGDVEEERLPHRKRGHRRHHTHSHTHSHHH